jgi:Rrf2 family transcriptional regulator, iron-sulfur cluster assembly transcription factor
MWLSSTAQQAISAVFCIAAGAEHGPVRVDEIAGVIGCPRNYLSKILHSLVRAGILRSERGPKGGFQLSSPPEKVTLAQVIAPFERVGQTRCVLGRPQCSDRRPCMLHARWSRVAAPVDAFFAKTTVANLLGGNSRASDAAREAIGIARLSTRRKPYGSVAR